MPTQTDLILLATELRTAVSRLLKKLRSHSPTRNRLSLTELAVIKSLLQQPRLPSELAAQEKVTIQSMSQLLRRLTELDYLTRQPAGPDKRQVLIGLSAAGQALASSVRQEADEWLLRVLRQACSAEEIATLQRALPILAKLHDWAG